LTKLTGFAIELNCPKFDFPLMSKAPPAVCRYFIGGSEFEAPSLSPGLYLIATPIGNLRDITIRALETLASVDVIYCEDTRITSRLLSRYGIAKPLKPYHDHNAAKVRPAILDALREGARVALTSDAGTPLISDPGYKLVVEAINQEIHLEMRPGPTAAIVALALSGFPGDRFLFAGFLPPRPGARMRALDELKNIPAALIFFEAASRLEETLAAFGKLLPGRRVAIARELTKLHEEILRGAPDDLLALVRDRGRLKGEITIVVEPPLAAAPLNLQDLEAALEEALHDASPARAASVIARKFAVPRKDVYHMALRLKARPKPSGHDA
jgi:16S rRNA (cytidine1402-2'-O)-methyltransferase